MKTIPLRGEKAAGRVALVDDEDYDLVMQHKWRVQVGSAPIGRPPVVYARTSIGRKTLGMHQMLTGYMQTDHANGNGLDNQRHNLRPATQTQNRFNTPKPDGCACPYKGVTKAPRSNSWRARITIDGRSHHLGTFGNAVEAAHIYDLAAVEAFGEYAFINFPSMLPGGPDEHLLRVWRAVA